MTAAPAASAGLKDPTTLTRILQIALGVILVVDAVAIGSGILHVMLLQDLRAEAVSTRTLARAAVGASQAREHVIAAIQIAMFAVGALVFMWWTYVVGANARQLGATGLRFTPGWAVGWYFVPVANLWKPYQALTEIWQVSAAPDHWESQPRGPILPLWWTALLATGIFVLLTVRMSLRANRIPALLVASKMSMATTGVSMIAMVLTMMLVQRICRMQTMQIALSTPQQRADDDKVALIVEKLRPLGQKWVDEFLSAYRAMPDKRDLPDLVQRIIASARAEYLSSQKQ